MNFVGQDVADGRQDASTMTIDSITDIWPQERLQLSPPGEAGKVLGSGFFRGSDCNFNPHQADHAGLTFARDFLLKGWMPPSRFLTRSSRITAFGSCFAQNITTHLSALGFDTAKQRDGKVYISLMGEGLVNVYSLLQQFEWAFEDIAPPIDLWHGFDANAFGYDDEIRRRTREVFLKTDIFILTFGLSEVWYDEVSQGVFWRAVPMRSYDPARHKFRVLSFAETKAAMERMIGLIAKYVPDAAIITTLSPIPLAATFRPISCITANSVSKALLRAALDETLRSDMPTPRGGLHYFPAYEAVQLFPDPFEEDGRHLNDVVVPAIMMVFEAYFCDTSLTPAQSEAALLQARRVCANALADKPAYATTPDLDR